MARWFGGATVAVFVVGGVVSTVVPDSPNCTDVCNQEIVQYMTLGTALLIGLLWLILAFAEEVDRTRDRDR
jgi:hypothetical protein